MARTRSDAYPGNQQLILDRAAALFADRGFARASIAELARACRFSKAWLYHYYESKEQILHAMLDAHMRELVQASRQAIASSDDPAAQFRAFIRANVAIYARAPAKHMVLMTDLDHLAEAEREAIRQMERDLVDMVVDVLRRLNPSLAAHRALQKAYAMLFYGMINWTYVWYDPDGPVGPDRLAELAADLFLDGFLSQPRQ